MFRNYLTVTLRNIRKHKGYSLINIVGLAVGISSCLLILLFVESELSYDRFHEKAERIYRVGFKFHVGTNQFDMIYKTEVQASKVITAFACLAIFIACLGLLGLASYTASQRTKEIGIRKVLGATVSEVVLLLNKDFVKWVLMANLIAWPLAYYAMNKWLQNFAYRVGLNIWMFMGAAALALIIALLTVSYQSIKAARANPVDSLRYE